MQIDISCEGSRLQNGGLTLLLISLPADSTTVLLMAKIVNAVGPGKGSITAYTKPSSAIDGSEWVRCDFGRGSSELAERKGIKIVSKADFTFWGRVLMRLSQSFFLLRRAFPISLYPLLAEDLQALFPLFVG